MRRTLSTTGVLLLGLSLLSTQLTEGVSTAHAKEEDATTNSLLKIDSTSPVIVVTSQPRAKVTLPKLVGFVDIKDQVVADSEMAIGGVARGASTHAVYFKKEQATVFVNSVPNAKAADATLEQFSKEIVNAVKGKLGSDVLEMKSEVGQDRVTFTLRSREGGEVRTYVQRYYFFHGGPHAIQIAVGLVDGVRENQLDDFWRNVSCISLPPLQAMKRQRDGKVLIDAQFTVKLPGNPQSLVFSPSGKQLFASSVNITRVPDVFRAVTILDATTGTKLVEKELFREMPANPWTCAVDSTFKKIAYRLEHRFVIYDIAADQVSHDLSIRTDGLFRKEVLGPLQFTLDGKRLLGAVSSGRQGEICVWNTSSGEQETSLKGHDSSSICGLAISQGGERFASASESKEIILWDVRRLAAVARIPTPLQDVSCLAVSANGKRVAAAGEVWDEQLKKRLVEIQVFNTADGRKACSYRGHQAQVLALQFSPDGEELAAAIASSVVVLNAASGEVLTKTQIDAMGGEANCFAFTEDLAQIAVGFVGGKPFEPGKVIIRTLLGDRGSAMDEAEHLIEADHTSNGAKGE